MPQLEKRNDRTTNFLTDDIKKLQRWFDQEWELEKDQRAEKLKQAAQRKAAEEAELRKRRLLERQRAEEEDAVNSDPRIKFWIELVSDGTASCLCSAPDRGLT